MSVEIHSAAIADRCVAQGARCTACLSSGYQALQLAAQGVRGELPSLPVIVALQAHQVTRENLVQRERAREPGLSANR